MNKPQATLLLSSHCPHCATLLNLLNQLLKSGELSQLHSINIDVAPEIAQKYAVRSVPWLQIGDYVLTGLHDMPALKQRLEWTQEKANLLGKFDQMLSNAQANEVVESIREDHSRFSAIVALLEDPATILSSRIGIGVIMEEFAGTELIQSHRLALEKLLEVKEERIRADVAYYLELTQSKEAIPALQQHADDENADVREIIADSLNSLQHL